LIFSFFSQSHQILGTKTLNRLLQIIVELIQLIHYKGKEIEDLLGAYESKISKMGNNKISIENNPNQPYPFSFLIEFKNLSLTDFEKLKEELKSKSKNQKIILNFELDDEYKLGISLKGEKGSFIMVLYDEPSKFANFYIMKGGDSH
jgi:hypothetical protein